VYCALFVYRVIALLVLPKTGFLTGCQLRFKAYWLYWKIFL